MLACPPCSRFRSTRWTWTSIWPGRRISPGASSFMLAMVYAMAPERAGHAKVKFAVQLALLVAASGAPAFPAICFLTE